MRAHSRAEREPTPARAGSELFANAVSLAVPVAIATAVLVVAGEWIGARWPSGWNWGFNAYAFLPAPLLPLTTLAAVVLATLAWRSSVPATAGAPAARPATRTGQWTTLVLAALAGVAFYVVRTRHLLLGDGLLVGSAPTDWQVPPLEPLSGVLVQAFWRLVQILPSEAGRAANDVAWDAAAIGSSVAGAILVFLTPGLIRALGVGARDATGDEAPRSEWGSTALWAMAAFLAQGWLVVVCGYPETYAYALVGLVVYLRCCAEVADGRWPLRYAGLALLLAIGLHLSAFALAPSFLFLAWRRLRDPSTRHEAGRDLGTVGIVSIGLFAVLLVALQGVFLPATLLETAGDVLGGVARPHADGRPWWSHLVDQFNGQALSGPLSAGFFVVLAIAAIAQWRRLVPRHHALLLCGAAMLAITLIAGDSNLGYARNWDLLAPWAMVMMACGLAMLPALLPTGPTLRRVLAVLTLASAVHTLGWVGVNTSQAASIARFTALPLGMGRVESTLGYWYMRRGDAPNAERWLARALNANPANLRAHLHFGLLFMEQHRYPMAVEAYRAVVSLRPASVEYGLSLAEALRLNGDPAGAAAELKRVLTLDPHSTRARMMYGVVLIDLGRPGEARDVLNGAL